jgi:enoyl-CoA hydratase
MLLSGRWLTAPEALKLKLVNRILPRAALYPEAIKLAEKIKSYSPAAVSAIKQAVTRGLDMTLSEGLELEKRLGRGLTADTKL